MRADEFTTKVLSVSPLMARSLLNTMTLRNRNIREPLVTRFVKDMQNGKWSLNGESLKFAKDGSLIDGQHRLIAVVKSNTTQKFLAIYGLDKKLFVTFDNGKPRSFSDVLDIENVKMAHNLSAVTRKLLAWYKNPSDYLVAGFNQFSNQELLDYFKTLDVDYIRKLLTRYNELYNHNYKLITPANATFYFYVLREYDVPVAENFMLKLYTDKWVDVDNSVHRLHQFIKGHKENKLHIHHRLLTKLVFDCWNKYLIDKKIKAVYIPQTHVIPILSKKDLR